MDLNEARTLLGRQWPAIVAAVNDPVVRATPGGVQQYVWASMSRDYLSRGEAFPAGSLAAVNRLLSLAGQQRAASLALAGAITTSARSGLDQQISATHIAPSIDSLGPGSQALGTQYRVIYETQHIVNGEAVQAILTHDLGFQLPQSLSSLQSTIEQAAQVEAADYGYEWGGIATSLSIQSY